MTLASVLLFIVGHNDLHAGTGLGLAIVQGVVERHLGRIELRSVPGQTEFIVFLPQSTGTV